MVEIDWLTNWFETNRSKLAEMGVRYSVFVRNTKTENPAQAFDVETKRYTARITLWESGECNFEALGLGASDFPIFKHQTIYSEDELHHLLLPLLSNI